MTNDDAIRTMKLIDELWPAAKWNREQSANVVTALVRLRSIDFDMAAARLRALSLEMPYLGPTPPRIYKPLEELDKGRRFKQQAAQPQAPGWVVMKPRNVAETRQDNQLGDMTDAQVVAWWWMNVGLEGMLSAGRTNAWSGAQADLDWWKADEELIRSTERCMVQRVNQWCKERGLPEKYIHA